MPTRQLKIDQKKNPKGLLELTAPKEESGANFIHLNIFKSFSFCPGSRGGASKGENQILISLLLDETGLSPLH